MLKTLSLGKNTIVINRIDTVKYWIRKQVKKLAQNSAHQVLESMTRLLKYLENRGRVLKTGFLEGG